MFYMSHVHIPCPEPGSILALVQQTRSSAQKHHTRQPPSHPTHMSRSKAEATLNTQQHQSNQPTNNQPRVARNTSKRKQRAGIAKRVWGGCCVVLSVVLVFVFL